MYENMASNQARILVVDARLCNARCERHSIPLERLVGDYRQRLCSQGMNDQPTRLVAWRLDIRRGNLRNSVRSSMFIATDVMNELHQEFHVPLKRSFQT